MKAAVEGTSRVARCPLVQHLPDKKPFSFKLQAITARQVRCFSQVEHELDDALEIFPRIPHRTDRPNDVFGYREAVNPTRNRLVSFFVSCSNIATVLSSSVV